MYEAGQKCERYWAGDGAGVRGRGIAGMPCHGGVASAT